MIFNCLLGLIRKIFFSGRRRQKTAWPETELIDIERAEVRNVLKNYNTLILALALDSNRKLNELSQKYNNEALQLIYHGFFHIDDFHDVREIRRALQQVIDCIELEAAQFK